MQLVIIDGRPRRSDGVEEQISNVYPITEHAVAVAREVTLTNDATREAVTYKAGNGWTVDKGMPVLWDVKTPRFVKHYMAVA